MRSKSYLFLLLVVGLGVAFGVMFALLPARYGLDVKGGIRLTYQMQLSQKDRQNLDSIRSRLTEIMLRRISGNLGATEGTVVSKGPDQLVIELPGYSDPEKAESVIGSSARIKFYYAKNVTNRMSQEYPYSPVEEDDPKLGPTVAFRKTFGGTNLIKPGMPEYQHILDGWDLILEGEDLQSAQPLVEGEKEMPEMVFSPAGTEKMRTWSTTHQNIAAQIATVLDGRVLSLADVEDNTVLSDSCYIKGTFTHTYVKGLCDLLNAGALPVELKKLGSENLSPTIGADALTKMKMAGVIAFVVIAVFLISYYAFPGVVAVLALSLYVLFTLTVLKIPVVSATFSLAGIAGFILSVGMAVNANILVFERLKEEIKLGKKLHAAIDLGFRRALPAIIDSNMCTILTSLVLLTVGTGPVKGFATTLIIGVLISLFTAVVVTRSLLMFFVGSGIGDHVSWYAVNRNWFGAKFDPVTAEPLVVVEKAIKWFGISLATIVVGFIFFSGFKLNVEFRGGYQAGFAVPTVGTVNTNAITASLERAGFKGSNVQVGTYPTGGTELDITVPNDVRLSATKDAAGKDITDTDREQIIAQAAGLTNAKPQSFSFVGPTIQREIIQGAVEGVIFSSLLVVLYLAIRFGTGFGGFAAGMRFGLSAIGALIHDILVVIGTAALVGFWLKWEISALFLTAMLTMIGFSVHDTIVIFDRIRENLRRPKVDEQFGHLIDRSITQSFARSINTSGTVIVTLLILVIFGTPTPELKFFIVAMMVGIISGTYSSIYNASPILYLWDKAIGKRKGAAHTLVAMANAELKKHQVITTRISEPAVQSPSGGRSYGQVRRRANQAQQRGHIEIEEEEEP